MEIVKIENVRKVYKLGKTFIEALKGVSLRIEEGKMICIMGPSGSGKSTLLHIIGAIDYPSEGKVFVYNTDLSNLDDSKLAEFRNKVIGFIFQSFNLIPVLTAYENVEYPLLLQKISKKERKRRVEEILESTGIKHLAKQRPNELSGGERQRVAIARALVTSPRIVIADEPTANLDHKTGSMILELMKDLNTRYKTTFIFSTHDPLVSKYANEVIQLMDGEIVKNNTGGQE